MRRKGRRGRRLSLLLTPYSLLLALVKCLRDDGELEEGFEGDDVEGGLVGGLEDDRAGGAGLLDL